MESVDSGLNPHEKAVQYFPYRAPSHGESDFFHHGILEALLKSKAMREDRASILVFEVKLTEFVRANLG